MALNQKGLGRGLGALFQDEGEATLADAANTQTLPIGALVPNPKQPRREFDDAALESLADSIKSQGVLQPILVRGIGGSRPPRYEIVAGERRWRASRLAGLKEVPVIIRELSDQETLAIALVENLQREDLNPLEEALGIQQLKDDFGLSQEDLARTLGKSRSAIANSLRLIHLGLEAQKALKDGRISAGHARALLSLDAAAEQDALLKQILEERLSVREAEGAAALKKSGVAASAASEAEHAAQIDVTPASASKPARPTAARLPQSAILLELQSKLAESIKLPVKLSGKEEKGRISISYSSKEELAALLRIIGVQAEF